MAKNRSNDIDSFADIFKVPTTSDTSNPIPAAISRYNKGPGRPKTGREIKKRITFTIRPSVNDRASEIAYRDNKSLSEVVEDLLIKYINKHK